MVKIKKMGSEWMCLLELSQEIVSILKTRACFYLSLTSAVENTFKYSCSRYALNTKKK